VADGLASLLVFDITNPRAPRQVGANTAFDAAYGLSIYNGNIFVPAGTQGTQILSLFTPFKFNPAPKVITNTAHVFVSGPTGQVFRIQRTTNLTAWSDWQSVSFANTNIVELVDTNYPANRRNFYRAVSP
jgi:hypothetical protein